MSLKKDSTYLIKSLHEQIPENNISFFKEDTHKIFLQFFSYFQESVDYIKSSIDLKSHLIVDEEISSPKDVPKAANFDYIVKEIKEYIFTHVKHKIVFRFSNFLGREVSFYFSLTKNEKKEDIFNYVFLMLVWLYVISKYTQNSRCSKKLNIFIYFKKEDFDYTNEPVL